MALDTTDYAYYKEITISNPSGAYQMRLWVHSGSGTDETGEEGHVFCNSNCNKWPEDIRFGTTQDPETATQLDTWYESGSTSSAPSSLIWVETQDVAGGASTLYMFIGDASADINNNGENTFLFFDDFNDESFDTNKWIEWYSAGGGDYHETGGYLMIDPGSSWQEVGSKYQYAAPKIFRMRAKTTTEAQAWGVGVDERSDGGGYQGAGADWITFGFQTSPQKFYRTKSETDEEYSARSTTLTSYTTLMIKAKSASVAFYENDVLRDTHTDNPPTDPMGFNFEGYGTGHDTYIDWCFVAKCTDSTEPSWASTGDWTSTLTPTLIVINASGALNIDNIYPSATLTGKITGLSGNCWIYWGISDGGNVIADWETSSNLGLQYYDKTGGYFTSSVSLLKNTGFRLSSATRYYYRVYGSSNGWGYGEDWAPSSAEWTTKSQWKLYFLSGITSTSPITPATEGYICSTNIRLNVSGSCRWNNLNVSNRKWHAYLYNESTDEWSSPSNPFSFTIPDINKFLFVYRNGANDAGSDICYRIVSGGNNGSEMILGEGNYRDECPSYPYSWCDKNNKIWVSWTYKDDEVDNWGSDIAIYSYAPSLNSWNGGYDYWFHPSGGIIGSGNRSDGGIGKGGSHAGISFDTFSSSKVMPVRGLHVGALHYTHYIKYTTMPNGELCCYITRYTDENEKGFWYYSSNQNTWNKVENTLFTGATFRWHGLAATKSNLALFEWSKNALCARISTDNGRTFTGMNLIEQDTSDEIVYYQYMHQCITQIGEEYPDEYARILVEKTTSNRYPNSGSIWIYKINTNNLNDYSKVKVYGSGSAYDLVLMGGYPGIFYNNTSMFVFPRAYGNVGNPYGSHPGDIRHIVYWNEITGDSGNNWYGQGESFSWFNHCAGNIKVDESGKIWTSESGYFGSYNPNYWDGAQSPSSSLTKTYSAIDTTGGGCGATVEVFR